MPDGRLLNRPTARNSQTVLVRAFREQMDEDYGKFEDEE